MITVNNLIKDYRMPAEMQAPELPNYTGFSNYMNTLITCEDRGTVYLDTDLDVDGIICSLIFGEVLHKLGVYDVEHYLPERKRHGIDSEAVEYYISNNAKFVIITDSSISNIPELKALVDADIKVLVVDHHETDLTLNDYPTGVTVCSNKIGTYNCSAISAGMLTYLLLNTYTDSFGVSLGQEYFVWGCTTLISDGCDLSDNFITPIILMLPKFDNFIPPAMLPYRDKYSMLCRNFLTYKFINKLNTLARTGRNDLIKSAFLNFRKFDISEIEVQKIMIDTIHSDISQLTRAFCADICSYVKDCGDVGYINLDDYLSLTNLSNDYLMGATGYISSELNKTYGKPVAVVCSQDRSIVKGSIRANDARVDLTLCLRSLNLLSGGGHKGAVGFTVSKGELQDFQYYLSLLKLETVGSCEGDKGPEELVINCDGLPYAEFERVFDYCTKHNEVSGLSRPAVSLLKTLNYSFKRKDYNAKISFSAGNVRIDTFNMNIDTSEPKLIKPVLDLRLVGIAN